jgi:predicted transcriptional regulator
MTRRKSKTGRVSSKRKLSRGTSKQLACLELLKQPAGATVGELQELTGWQEHSVRAFLAGTVKKKLGFDITSTTEERGRVYRIASR